MPGTQLTQGDRIYLSVIQGKLRQSYQVTKETPGAVLREYKLSDGTEGSKWELIYKDWSGVVRDLRVKDTDYGKMYEIVFDDATITLNTDHRFFQDFVKKFASADPKQAITLSPYDFENDEKKRVAGMTVTQNGKKLTDFFYDFEKKKYLNDFPMSGHTTKKPYDKDDWKAYFLGVKKFLLAYSELTIVPLLSKEVAQEEALPVSDDDSAAKLEEVPF